MRHICLLAKTHTVHALVKKVFEKRQTLNFLISRMLFIVMGDLVDPGLQDFQLNVHFSTAKTSNKIEILQNFERPFTPRGWLRSASNFGKTRFRWFPTFHFPTPKTKLDDFFTKKIDTRNFVFKKLAFWRSQTLLSVTGRFLVKSYCPKWVYFWGDFLGEGVNDSICVENLDLAPKMTSTI